MFSHGDFTHSQLLAGMDGVVSSISTRSPGPSPRSTWVSSSAICAWRWRRRSRRRDEPRRPPGRPLSTLYADAADVRFSPEAVRSRAEVYETISLFRSTVHAAQKLKAKRARTLFSILVDQVARLT